MGTKPSKAKKPPIKVTAFALTDADMALLRRVAKGATQHYGRAIGQSAVVRAALAYIGRQDAKWGQEHLFPLIEKELAYRSWGLRRGDNKRD